MRLTTFSTEGDSSPRIGVVEDQRVHDLHVLHEHLDPPTPSLESPPDDMRSLIALGEAGRDWAGALLEAAEGSPVPEAAFDLNEIVYEAAIPNTGKLICTGLNFDDYRRELGLEYLDVPQIFMKSTSAITGNKRPVQIPEGYGKVFHEWEFSCVIGKRCKGLTRDEVDEAIFGYTIVDDITAHDIELMTREYQQWAKSIDTFAPMGPWIVTRDDLEDTSDLTLIRRVNGEEKSRSTTAEMRYTFNDIVAFASTFMTLRPGDVITAGTAPAGEVGPGDYIEGEVEGIGVLENPVESIPVNPEYARAVGLME